MAKRIHLRSKKLSNISPTAPTSLVVRIMSSILNGNKHSAAGTRVPTDSAYCYPLRSGRAVIFEQQGNFVRANDCRASGTTNVELEGGFT